MSKYFVVAVAILLIFGGFVALTEGNNHNPNTDLATACLAVAPGVCFSGSVDWVVHTAERMAIPTGSMADMLGNAI